MDIPGFTLSVMGSRERLLEILEALASREYVSPGDIVVATGLPRYLVLATFQCLEALGFVEQVYSRGSYKVYTLTLYGRRLLEALKSSSEAPVATIIGPFFNIASKNGTVQTPTES